MNAGSPVPAPRALGESLERHLGDPYDPAHPACFADAVACDEREEFPARAGRAVEQWGVHHFYVPARHGGRLHTLDQLLAIVRAMARRDLSLAIGHGVTFLGCVPIWLAGDDALQARLAARVLAGEPVALALTEEEHGADLLGCDTHALADPAGGFRVSGRKWLINNATRGGALSLFARTAPGGGQRGFTFFLVEKERLPGASFGYIPKQRTHGIRGADISGIELHEAPLGDDARVGALGSGLEVVLKGFLVTRTLCGGLSLGACDTALRVTLDFARSRRLYGTAVWDMPYPRDTLAGAFAELLLCDALTASALRALHAVPGQVALRAAAVKYHVPTRVDALLQQLAVVLGARYYLREGHAAGIFQKMLRDHAVVSLFDGSTTVNLNVVAAQLELLAAQRRPAPAPEEAWQRLAPAYTLEAPLPALDPARLSLVMERGDDERHALPEAARMLAALPLEADVRAALVRLTQRLSDELDSLVRRTREAGRVSGTSARRGETLERARRQAELNAALAGLYVFVCNRERQDDAFFAGGAWLALVLTRVLAPEELHARATAAWSEAVAVELERRWREGLAFALLPARLAGPTRAPAA